MRTGRRRAARCPCRDGRRADAQQRSGRGARSPAPRRRRRPRSAPLAARSLRRDQASAVPVAARADAAGLLQTRRRRRLADVARLHVAVAGGLWRQQPDDAVVGQRAQSVDECVAQVTVAVPPPHHDPIDDVVVVLVDELLTGALDDRLAQILVAVVVPTDLLDDCSGGDPELVRQSVLTCRAAGGGAHWSILPWVFGPDSRARDR